MHTLLSFITRCLSQCMRMFSSTAARDVDAVSFRLHEAGAQQVFAVCTHGILSGPALTRINQSIFEKVVVTNTLPQGNSMKNCDKLEVNCSRSCSLLMTSSTTFTWLTPAHLSIHIKAPVQLTLRLSDLIISDHLVLVFVLGFWNSRQISMHNVQKSTFLWSFINWYANVKFKRIEKYWNWQTNQVKLAVLVVFSRLHYCRRLM